jgi:hypothetical protein
MALCLFCGTSAGWFRTQHPACKTAHERGRVDLQKLARRAVSGEVSFDTLQQQLTAMAVRSYLTPAQTQHALMRGWEAAVNAFLEDGVLSREDEAQLVAFCERFALTQADLNHRETYARFVKAAVLREVIEGHIPQRIELDGSLPFNFHKTEQLIWVFPDTHYYEGSIRSF